MLTEGTSISLDRKLRDVNRVSARAYKLKTPFANTWWDMIIVDTGTGERVDGHVSSKCSPGCWARWQFGLCWSISAQIYLKDQSNAFFDWLIDGAHLRCSIRR